MAAVAARLDARRGVRTCRRPRAMRFDMAGDDTDLAMQQTVLNCGGPSSYTYTGKRGVHHKLLAPVQSNGPSSLTSEIFQRRSMSDRHCDVVEVEIPWRRAASAHEMIVVIRITIAIALDSRGRLSMSPERATGKKEQETRD